MKKLLTLGVLFTLIFSLTACNFGDDDPDPECTENQTLVDGVCEDNVVADTTAPVVTGVDDVTIYVDATFDNLNGVSAIDNIDGDITSSIVITGTVDTATTGVYFLKYSSTDAAGNKTEATRYVTVEVDPSLIGDELIPNGDFSLGWSLWDSTTGNEGGGANFSVVDGVLNVEVTSVSGGKWEPRFSSRGIEMENGQTYEISFRAKADAARSIHIQVGQVLSAAPWFVDFKEGQTVIFDLGTEWADYSFKFTMNLDTNADGAVLFENGTVEGEVGIENLLTTIYYDDIVMVESTPDADETGPVFSGIEDITVELNDTFDPLEGVTAFDIVDQAIALTVANVTGTVDMATEGEYTLTYTVSDAAGNDTIKTRVVTVVGLVFNSTDAVVDGTFTTTTVIAAEVQDESNVDITDADIWYSWFADWEGAAATYTIVDGVLNIDVTAPGGAEWGHQFKQKGIELVKGQTYKLSFDASATADRDIIAKVTDNYALTVNLTSTMQTFELIFTYEGDTTDMAKVMFMLGNTASYAAGVISLDNIEILELDGEPAVMNPGFEDTGWSVWSHDNGSSIAIVNDMLEVTVASVGTANWAVQLFQEGFDLAAGSTYRITFDAHADAARTINAMMVCNGEFRGDQAITDTSATYTYDFTVVTACDNGKLDFELGLINGDVAGTVYLDNIKVEEIVSDAVVAETDQVVNGSFEEVLNWGVWSHDNGSSIAIVDDMLEVTVASVGSANWAVQLFQENVPMVVGGTYTIMFDAKADVARSINLKLISNVEDMEVFALSTEMATYSFTFVYSGNTDTAKLDFELGLIEAATAGTVTLDNVMVYRNFNPQD